MVPPLRGEFRLELDRYAINILEITRVLVSRGVFEVPPVLLSC